MTLAKNKLAVAIAIALTGSLGLVGCGDDKSVSTAVGVPNPNTLMPTGTVQGILRDTVTNEPIVGAIVDIGIAKATTSETGQFVIANVPATASIGAAAAGANAPYQVTIDLRNVKQAAGAAKYPNFSFALAAVTYSSLNDGSNDAGTSSSNHDTPVSGLTAPLALTVGKLAAGIKGTVARAADFTAVGTGYTVKLVSVGSLNSTTGNGTLDGNFLNGNVVATATTDATGAFVFSGIESLRNFRIEVINADGTEYGAEPVRSPADGQVKTLLAQRGAADPLDLRTVLVSSTDTLAPRVVKSTPETGTERAPGANVAVTFSFSEPIVSNGLTNSLTASTAGNGGLYDLVSVEFMGIKDIAMRAGNIPYSLAWDATRTQLTVIIPKVKASAKYKVSIAGAQSLLVDNQNFQTDFGFTGATSANAGVVTFSTNADGATKPAAVSTLAINNNADLDQVNNAVVDWLPVAGAKGYHVYRAKFVNDVMGSKGYEPIKRTAADTATAAAQLNAKQTLADAAKTAVATAKTAATTAAQVSAQAAQNANVADSTANTVVKAAAPTTAKIATSTAASAGLTEPAATNARAADKVAALSEISDTNSALKAVAANSSAFGAFNVATASNFATAGVARTKVADFNTAVNNASGLASAAAVSATTANTVVRTVNTQAMVAAKVAATIDAVADVAAAVSAVSAAASNVAKANLDAAQAAVNADPSNQAKKNVLAVAQTAFNNANKAALDKAKEAEAAAEVAKKALADAKTAEASATTAAGQAKVDANTAAILAVNTKVDAAAAVEADKIAKAALTAAQKALATANTNLTKAQDDLKAAKTAADAADATVDVNNALDAVEAAYAAALDAANAAAIADQLADQEVAAAAATADAATASTAAAKDAADAAVAATAAVAAITTAVNTADAAADAVDVATANDAAAGTQYAVLDNNAKQVDMWRAKTASALAKAMAASSVAVVTNADAAAAKATVVSAAAKAASVAKAAQAIADKANAAKTAVIASQVAATTAANKAGKNNDDAKAALTKATAAVVKATADLAAEQKKLLDAQAAATAAATALTIAQTTATNAAAALAAKPADAALIAADAAAKVVLAQANATKLSADANLVALQLSNPIEVAKKQAILSKATLAELAAQLLAADAASDLTFATIAKDAADAALTDVTAAKTAADKALVDANTAKTAADKLVVSMNAAETSIKATVADAAAAVKATADASTASTAAANASTAAATAATTKQQADKDLATKVKEQAAADKALADAQGAADSNGGYVDNTNNDPYLTQNTSFVEDGTSAFIDGIRKVTYKYKVRAVSEDNVESDDGNEVTAQDNTKPKVSSFTMSTASNVVTVVFNEPMNELDFRNQANYVLSAATDSTVTVPTLANALFKIDNRTVVLSYASNIPAGSTVTVSGLKDLAGNVMSEVGNTASVSKVSSNIAGFIGSTQVTVFFTAEMNKASAETAANYVWSAGSGPALLAANGVVYDDTNNSVTLTYVSAIPAGVTLTVSGVKDANGTVVDSNTKTFN